MPLTVVIAPDSFKGTLPALQVAQAIATGWRSVRPDDRLILIPQADGGEGTLDAITQAVPAALRRRVRDVTGPDGRPTRSDWLELPGGVAVVELAQSSGLPHMGAPDPMHATTRGLGEVIRHVLDAGAQSLVIGLGGSASTDGGAGALAALGLALIDDRGESITGERAKFTDDREHSTDGGGALIRAVRVDSSALVAAPPGGVMLLTDVTAPLLGPSGAATVFGPQKGASPAQVAELEIALAHYADLLGGDRTAPGAGAAGGTAFGFATVWGATIEPGADYLARISGLDAAIAGADVLLTGEGRFDDQSLSGKVVGQLLAKAAASGVLTGVIAGQVTTPSEAWTASLTDLAQSEEGAMMYPARGLEIAGALAARELGSTKAREIGS